VVQTAFFKNLNFIFLLKIIFLCVLDRFDALISKIIFKNKKYIILIYFNIKNILKNNYDHIPK
jgi:hypothetical protein